MPSGRSYNNILYIIKMRISNVREKDEQMFCNVKIK